MNLRKIRDLKEELNQDLPRSYTTKPLERIKHYAASIGRRTLLASAITFGSLLGGCDDSDRRSPVSIPHVNRPPVVQAIPDQTVLEGSQTDLDLNRYISDPDGDPLTVELTNGPGSITDKQFSYSDQYDNDHDDIIHQIEFLVRDGHGGEATGSFELTQQDVNRDPTIQPIPDQIVLEGGNLILDLDIYASDPDGDPLTIELISGPGFFTNKQFNYTNPVDSDHDDNIYRVKLRVKDGIGGTYSSFKLTQQDTTLYIEDALITDLIDAKHDISAHVQDLKSRGYDFKRFSLDQAPLFLYDKNLWDMITTVRRMSATIEDDDGNYHVFWLRNIDSIQRYAVYFKNGQIFHGKWVPNTKPVRFYWTKPVTYEENAGYATGMVDENGVDIPKKIRIDDISLIRIEPSNSFSEFDSSLSTVLQTFNAPKTVELTDGTIYQTDLGYIRDACGHGWESYWHDKLFDDCELIEQDKTTRTIPLADIQEIELTGNYLQLPCPVTTYNPQGKYGTQCREAIITYKTGATETAALKLTSESYFGSHTFYPGYRNYDKFIAHTNDGAILIPLDNVRRIIPR